MWWEKRKVKAARNNKYALSGCQNSYSLKSSFQSLFPPLFKGRQGPGKTGEGHVPPGQYLPFSSTCKTLWTPTTASQMEAEAQSWPRKQHPNPRTGQPSNRATVALWEMDLKFNNGNSIQKLVVSSPPLGSGSSFLHRWRVLTAGPVCACLRPSRQPGFLCRSLRAGLAQRPHLPFPDPKGFS